MFNNHEISKRAYMAWGLGGIFLSLLLSFVNFLNNGRCVSGGRLGTQLCGNDIYIYCVLIIIPSCVACVAGMKKK